MAVKFIPEGYHTVTPYLVVSDVDKLLQFLEATFNAATSVCGRDGQGKAQHAEVKIGDSMIMIGAAPQADQVTNTMLYLYVEDTDAYYKKAIAAGALSIKAPENQFYGDRNAAVQDFSGNQWWFATRVEELSPEELKKRAEAYHG